MCVTNELTFCVPAPPVLSLAKRTGNGAVGYTLASCPDLVSAEEDGRIIGRGCTYVELALPRCFHDNDSLTVYSLGTASASESSFQSLLLFSFSFSPFSPCCLRVCKRSISSPALPALLFTLDVEHHLHLNRACLRPPFKFARTTSLYLLPVHP